MGIAITYAIANLAVLGLFFYVTYSCDRETSQEDKLKAIEVQEDRSILFLYSDL